jgi:recombination protein RecR
MAEYIAESFTNLIDEFQKMPGIGPKSAQRLAFYVLSTPQGEAEKLADTIKEAKKRIKYCSSCFNITEDDPCRICSNGVRDKSSICVVAEPKDLIALEKMRQYRGLYHVLGGVISPLDGMGPENLRIKELLQRITPDVKEIVLAMNPSVEGEATIIYIMKLVKPLGVKLTRIAYGLPVGSDMDYADEVTLTKAFEGRREVSL